MVTEVHPVLGMTCGHCVSAVEAELRAVPGVTDVRVDLHAGGTSRVTVVSAEPLDTDTVSAAVTEAGYTLAGESGPGSDGRNPLPLA